MVQKNNNKCQNKIIGFKKNISSNKILNLFLIMFFLIGFIPNGVFAQKEIESKNVEMVVFYGDGCTHCAKLHKFLDEIEPNYPSLNIIKYELYNNKSNLDYVKDFEKRYDVDIKGVPSVFINDKYISGYSSTKASEIENEIKYCLENDCVTPSIYIVQSENEDEKDLSGVTVLGVIGASLVDAINPCAFAVLIILLTTILGIHNRRKALFAGLAFSLSIFISYFLMGIGLYSAIASTNLTTYIYTFLGVLAIILGILNIKDYFWYGKGILMEVPRSWRPKLKSLLGGVTSVYGAFFIGFIVSLFLLPCTSGPYIVILGMLAENSTKYQATLLLLLYNLIFVLPMIIITLLVYFGLAKTEKLEKMRSSKLQVLHLIAGIILLILGGIMLFL